MTLHIKFERNWVSDAQDNTCTLISENYLQFVSWLATR